jgi:hypothetical protein
LDWALAVDPDLHARRVRAVVPAFDGAAQLTAYLSRWLGEARFEDHARARTLEALG